MTKEIIVIVIAILAAFFGGMVMGEASGREATRKALELGKKINDSWYEQCAAQSERWATISKRDTEKIESLEKQLAEQEHPKEEGWNTK